MSSVLNHSYAPTSSQTSSPSKAIVKTEDNNTTQNSNDFGSVGFNSSNLFLTKPYPNPNSNSTVSDAKDSGPLRDRSLPGVFSLTKPPEAMNYSNDRLAQVNGVHFSQTRHDYPEHNSPSYSETNSRYEGRGELLLPPHLPRLNADLQQQNHIPFRRHSVAGLPGGSYSLPLPHISGREAQQPSSLSQSFTPEYAHDTEAEKHINENQYSSSLKRKESSSNSTNVPASAFKRRASMCDPLPPPPQIFSFSGSSHAPGDNINSATGSLKLPKIEEIEGYSSEYSEKSPPPTQDRPLHHHHLLDRPAFRHEHMMGRRASLPVISFPHQSLINERGSDQALDSSHSSYVFPSPSDGDKISPYSRTPALKVSHKLAERKRRKEMKDLFDELRDNLPVDKNIKTSKWEILSKSIEYIRQLQEGQDKLSQEIRDLRQQVVILKQGRRRSD